MWDNVEIGYHFRNLFRNAHTKVHNNVTPAPLSRIRLADRAPVLVVLAFLDPSTSAGTQQTSQDQHTHKRVGMRVRCKVNSQIPIYN